MFKKAIKTSTHNLMSGKDMKKLKKDLCKLFDSDSVTKFFENNDKLSCDKLSGSKILMYTNDDYPVLIDATGKGDYFPTSNYYKKYKKIYFQKDKKFTYIIYIKFNYIFWFFDF